ncbi:hypothetical protein LUZ60_006186 [Juncus effusus]|nr:hypothetical protein LUZ60_006186 [Juncus effusus]
MELSALLTSAGINIGLCLLFVSLYSILRKQPGNRIVYFGRKLTEKNKRQNSEHVGINRLCPSLRWLIKIWNSSEDDILQCAGFDAVVFLRILVFSIRVFVVAFVCGIVVIIVNYNGKNMTHKVIPSEPLEIFTIANVKQGSKSLWVHCLALYIITLSAIYLLHHEYKSIARMRSGHVRKPPMKPSQFTVLVRSIPKSDQFLSDTVSSFFMNYHAASYLSHQIIYPAGKYQNLMATAHKVYRKFARLKLSSLTANGPTSLYRCGLCGGSRDSQPTRFRHLSHPSDPDQLPQNPHDLMLDSKDCVSAFVFFKTRYAATIAWRTVQASNPMMWVTQEAPEPHDVYWSNLSIPYKQLWFRRILVLVLSLVFMFVFLLPVAAVQGLTQLDKIRKVFPFFKDILNKPYVMKVVTGYLPSVILLTAFYVVPPIMMLFSAMEGSVSRSGRKKSACFKVTYFTIWNIFFVNVLSGTAISQLNEITRPKDMASHLAEAVPKQDLIEMDRDDEISGRMEEIHEHLLNAYNQFSDTLKETEDEEEVDEIELYTKEYTDSVVADPNPLSSSFSQEIKPMRAELDVV